MTDQEKIDAVTVALTGELWIGAKVLLFKKFPAEVRRIDRGGDWYFLRFDPPQTFVDGPYCFTDLVPR